MKKHKHTENQLNTCRPTLPKTASRLKSFEGRISRLPFFSYQEQTGVTRWQGLLYTILYLKKLDEKN